MNFVSKELQGRVNAKLNQCIAIAEKHFGQTFRFPIVKYQKRGTTAGTADCLKWVLDFNAVIFNENVEDFLARTVPHEMAHLIDYQVYQKQARMASFGAVRWTRSGPRRAKREVHGPTWKSIMRLLGAPESRCHSYDVTNARVKRSGNRVTYVCGGCGKSYDVGPKHHNAILRGGKVWCRLCKTDLTPAMRVVAQPQPQRIAAQTSVAPTPPPAPRAGSKLDQAMTILATHGGYNREQLIDLIRRDTGMSRAGAQTYYYSAKKRLESAA